MEIFIFVGFCKENFKANEKPKGWGREAYHSKGVRAFFFFSEWYNFFVSNCMEKLYANVIHGFRMKKLWIMEKWCPNVIHRFQTRELRISINGINYYYTSKVYGELYAIVIHRFQKELDTSSPLSRVSQNYILFWM
jgi:hypothetical protein